MKTLRIIGVIIVILFLTNIIAMSICFFDFIDSVIWRIFLIINELGAMITTTYLLSDFDKIIKK